MPKLLTSFLVAVIFHALVVMMWAYKWQPKTTDVLSTSQKINLQLSSNESENQKRNSGSKNLVSTKNTATSPAKSVSQHSEEIGHDAVDVSTSPLQNSNFTESDFMAASLTYTEPIYPKLAIRRGLEGNVRIRLRISLEGHVEATEILKSSGHDSLDKAVLDSVPQWKFQKKESPYFIEKTVIFKLKN